MIKAVIIDDEAPNRKTLEVLLQRNFRDLEISGQAADVKTGLALIKEHAPQIVFLDIQMPDGSGLDLLRQLKDHPFEVIFTTAHDQYALDAFRLSAIGYLLKPISEKELRTAVQKAIELVQNKEHNNELQVKALMENLKSGQGKMPKLVLPDSDGFQVIDVDDITYLEADRNYTKICLRDKTPLLSSYNLGWFEKAIENAGFFRISKSHIINLKYLQRFIKGEGGFIVMSDNTQLSISPGRKEELKKHFL